MSQSDESASETHRFEFSLWNFAPDEWVNPGDGASFRVVDAYVAGEEGNEEMILEMERYGFKEDETDG